VLPTPKSSVLDGACDLYASSKQLEGNQMSHLKIEAARRQLGTAMALYLQNQDPVSVHCLAGGGCELIEYYAQKPGAEPFFSHIVKTYPSKGHNELKNLQRQFWNAFKHATHRYGDERDDDELLSRFIDEQNDALLYIGWYDYAQVTGKLPIEAQAHQAWYIALHPEKLSESYSSEDYEQLFPNVCNQPRAKQKRMLVEAIEHARGTKDVMSHPATEKRSLILGWPPSWPS
jgi:hypothetical protein